ncbi:MAG TPA: RodZ domain-containing protein [Steroidobacteraceae bacterium]
MTVDAAGIGARLRAGRERLGLTVLQAAERLHVDARVLESLESDDFEALGAPVYARGHLRRYAGLVGESVPDLEELYSRNMPGREPDLTRIAKPAGGDSGRLVALAVFVLAVFGVAGAVWWITSMAPRKPHPEQSREIGTAAPTPLTDTAQDGNRQQPGSGGGGSAASEGSDGRARHSDTGASATAALEAAAAQARTSAAGTRLASAGTTTGLSSGPAAGPGTVAENHARPSGEEQLTLRFSADSWTEIYDASGQRLFFDVGAADSVRTLKGTPPFRVVLGNAPGVAIEVNGRSAAIAKLAGPDGSAQFFVNRSGRAIRTRPAAGGG